MRFSFTDMFRGAVVKTKFSSLKQTPELNFEVKLVRVQGVTFFLNRGGAINRGV